MACSLNRPDTPAARVRVGEPQRLRVAACAGRDRLLRDNRTRRRDDDRENALIAVRVDADHVIHLICKHPSDPPIPLVGSSDAGLMQGNRGGRTVMSHARTGRTSS
jgi:hypothetical protein